MNELKAKLRNRHNSIGETQKAIGVKKVKFLQEVKSGIFTAQSQSSLSLTTPLSQDIAQLPNVSQSQRRDLTESKLQQTINRLSQHRKELSQESIYLHTDFKGLILPNYPEVLQNQKNLKKINRVLLSNSCSEIKNINTSESSQEISANNSISASSIQLKQHTTQKGFPFPPYSGIAWSPQNKMVDSYVNIQSQQAKTKILNTLRISKSSKQKTKEKAEKKAEAIVIF